MLRTVWLNALLPALEDGAARVRAATADALALAVQLEPPARPTVEAALVRLLDDPDAEVRSQAVTALRTVAAGERGSFPPELVGKFCALARDPSPWVRRAAVAALACGPRTGEKDAALLAALGSSDRSVRATAVSVVASIGATEEMVPLLISALLDPDCGTSAREALERIPEARAQMTQAIEVLGKRLVAAIKRAGNFCLQDDRGLEDILGALGPAAAPHLSALLRVWDHFAFPPERGLQATGRAGAAEIARILREGTRKLRETAAEALSAFPPYSEVTDALIAATRDASPSVRATAVSSLGLVAAGSVESELDP